MQWRDHRCLKRDGNMVHELPINVALLGPTLTAADHDKIKGKHSTSGNDGHSGR